MTIKVVIFNFSQLNRGVTFCRNLLFFLTYFKTNEMAEAREEILDLMLANLDLDEDIKYYQIYLLMKRVMS